MLVMTQEAKEFMRKELPDYAESDNLDEVLLALDEWITDWGYDENWEPNERGRLAERVLDTIYVCNAKNGRPPL